MRGSGVLIRFVTNTTKESKNILLTRLTNCGFDLRRDEIFSSLTAAHHYVKGRNLKYEMYEFCELRIYINLNCDYSPLLLLEPAALSDFEGAQKDGDINAVVIGLTKSNFHYECLNEAFR